MQAAFRPGEGAALVPSSWRPRRFGRRRAARPMPPVPPRPSKRSEPSASTEPSRCCSWATALRVLPEAALRAGGRSASPGHRRHPAEPRAHGGRACRPCRATGTCLPSATPRRNGAGGVAGTGSLERQSMRLVLELWRCSGWRAIAWRCSRALASRICSVRWACSSQ